MEALWQDLKYGLRTLAKNPGFTAVAVLTIALGIGINAALFNLVNAILLRPLPVRDPSELTVLAEQQDKTNSFSYFSYPDYLDFRDHADAFSGLLAYKFDLVGLSTEGKADRALVNYVSGNYFTLLGLDPALGRLILPGEGDRPGADPVLVLSYTYWQSRFGGDRGVIGKKVLVNGRPFTVVGIAPEKFYGLYSLVETQAYMPMGMATGAEDPNGFWTEREKRTLRVLGRLKPGLGLAAAQASLRVVADRLAQQYPNIYKGMTMRVFPERQARPEPDPTGVLTLVATLFLFLAGLVLLVACVNVANLLLVRATVREREMAIRAALGADRRRLVRQLLTESLLLALLGGAGGILLGQWASGLLSSIRFDLDLPVRLDFSFDAGVFAYAFGSALLTGILVGLVPALRASRANLNDILHEGGRAPFCQPRASSRAQCPGGSPGGLLADTADHCWAVRPQPAGRAAHVSGLRSGTRSQLEHGPARNRLRRDS